MTMMVGRVRQYFTRKRGPASAEEAASAPAPAAPPSGRRETTVAATLATSRQQWQRQQQQQRQQQLQNRRRLQRGWWPDADKRAERSFRAMEDLKDETFVVTEEHLEWVFDEPKDENGRDNDIPFEPRCHLILPSPSSSPKTLAARIKCNTRNNDGTRTSGECAICMTGYDVGDVVTRSPSCPHAFHQCCVLDWLSRDEYYRDVSNRRNNGGRGGGGGQGNGCGGSCPTCRAAFWVDHSAGGRRRSRRSYPSNSLHEENNHDSTRHDDDDDDDDAIRRPRADTAETDVLSEQCSGRGNDNAGGEENGRERSRGPSFDGDSSLGFVAE